MANTTPLFVFAPLLVSTLTLCLLFSYLYVVHRERYLGIWTAAWGMWLTRLAYSAFGEGMQFAADDAITKILAMSYTTLVLLGAAEFSRRRVAAVWLSLAIAAVLFNVLGPPPGPWTASRVTYLLVFGVGWIWAGVLFERGDVRVGERWIPAIALMLMGLHAWSGLIIQSYPAYVPWALSTTLALQIAIAVGVLLVFERRGRIRLGEAHAELEQALTNALAGYIPICANCKSIRDEQNEWRTLETYLTARTGTQLSHGICPVCIAELYPEYPDSI